MLAVRLDAPNRAGTRQLVDPDTALGTLDAAAGTVPRSPASSGPPTPARSGTRRQRVDDPTTEGVR
jgi:hypothetical protein